MSSFRHLIAATFTCEFEICESNEKPATKKPQQQETIHEIKQSEKNSSSYLKLSASEYEQANLRYFFSQAKI